MAASLLSCFYNFFMGSRWIAEFDIIFYGISEKIYLLEYFANIGKQTVQCVIPHIYTADCNFSSVNIPKPGDQVTKRTFSGTGRTDDSRYGSFGYSQAHMIQNLVFAIRKRNIIKNNIVIFRLYGFTMLVHDGSFVNFVYFVNRNIQ